MIYDCRVISSPCLPVSVPSLQTAFVNSIAAGENMFAFGDSGDSYVAIYAMDSDFTNVRLIGQYLIGYTALDFSGTLLVVGSSNALSQVWYAFNCDPYGCAYVNGTVCPYILGISYYATAIGISGPLVVVGDSYPEGQVLFYSIAADLGRVATILPTTTSTTTTHSTTTHSTTTTAKVPTTTTITTVPSGPKTTSAGFPTVTGSVLYCPEDSYGEATWPSTPESTSNKGHCASGYSGSPTRACLTGGIWSPVTTGTPCIPSALTTGTPTPAITADEGLSPGGKAGVAIFILVLAGVGIAGGLLYVKKRREKDSSFLPQLAFMFP